MSLDFRIPKQSDSSLLKSITKIRDEMDGTLKVRINVLLHDGGKSVDLVSPVPSDDPQVTYILEHKSQILPALRLLNESGNHLLVIDRRTAYPTDRVSMSDDAWRHIQPNRSEAFVRMLALARKYLKADTVEFAPDDSREEDLEKWRGQREATIDKLETVLTDISTGHAKRMAQADLELRQRQEESERKFREDIEAREAEFAARQQQERDAIAKERSDLEQRLANFKTKEARYQAREHAEDLLKQAKGWLNEWKLTKGTSRKRLPVTIGFWVGVAFLAALTFLYSSAASEQLAKEKLADVTWWQWVLLTLKPLGALAACITLLISAIRWSQSWAKQHAEEEFKNRTRVLDLGRSAWLLEAVIAAQDQKEKLPDELLRELSRNLFADHRPVDGGELASQNVADVLLHGLSSLRVRQGADGTEVEAKREKR